MTYRGFAYRWLSNFHDSPNSIKVHLFASIFDRNCMLKISDIVLEFKCCPKSICNFLFVCKILQISPLWSCLFYLNNSRLNDNEQWGICNSSLRDSIWNSHSFPIHARNSLNFTNQTDLFICATKCL